MYKRQVVFHSITTGASNDIEQATKLARAMLTRYGMSDEFDMVALETVNNQYLGGDTSLACSAQTQCDGVEHHFLGGTSAGEGGNLVFQLLLVHQVVVALVHLHLSLIHI